MMCNNKSDDKSKSFTCIDMIKYILFNSIFLVFTFESIAQTHIYHIDKEDSLSIFFKWNKDAVRFLYGNDFFTIDNVIPINHNQILLFSEERQSFYLYDKLQQKVELYLELKKVKKLKTFTRYNTTNRTKKRMYLANNLNFWYHVASDTLITIGSFHASDGVSVLQIQLKRKETKLISVEKIVKQCDIMYYDNTYCYTSKNNRLPEMSFVTLQHYQKSKNGEPILLLQDFNYQNNSCKFISIPNNRFSGLFVISDDRQGNLAIGKRKLALKINLTRPKTENNKIYGLKLFTIGQGYYLYDKFEKQIYLLNNEYQINEKTKLPFTNKYLDVIQDRLNLKLYAILYDKDSITINEINFLDAKQPILKPIMSFENNGISVVSLYDNVLYLTSKINEEVYLYEKVIK